MSQSFALYQPGDSRLHSLDPRVKLAMVLCLLLLSLTFGSTIVLAGLLLLALAGMALGHIQPVRIRWIVRLLAPTLALVAILWVLFYPSTDPLFSLWILKPGADNLAQALSIALRLAIVAFGTFLWLFTTNQAELVLSLVSLGLPYEVGLMLAIAFEQIPGLAHTYATVKQSYMARGLDPDKGGVLQRVRAAFPILIATIISSLRRADELSYVLQARALGAAPRRTHLHVLAFSQRDRRWLAATILLTICLLVSRWVWGLGDTPLWLLN